MSNHDNSTGSITPSGGGRLPWQPSLDCNCSNYHGDDHVIGTTAAPTGQSELDAFLYIVVVLLVYAMIMMLLMVKYIKRENVSTHLCH